VARLSLALYPEGNCVFETVGSILGGIFGSALGQRRESRHASERMKAFHQGRPVRVPCALRYEGETFWRHGDLILSRTESAWVPPKMTTGKIALPRQDIEIQSVRKATFKESMDVDPSCIIITCRLRGRGIDLAIPRKEMDPVLATFEFPVA
jgi:hypothetical protein